jgi:F420-dependent oxidoreductase-like protein
MTEYKSADRRCMTVPDRPSCTVRFSLWPDTEQPWADLVAVVDDAERGGWDRVYVSDHLMPNTDSEASSSGSVLECFAVVAALAARTERVGLGTLVASATFRHPAVVAKAATTIDQICGGRLVLGLGAGWQLNEHAVYGIELHDVPTRLSRFEEYCQVVTGLLRDDRTDIPGRFFRVNDAPCEPKPVQPRLRILIGGKGERRTMRAAACFADEWNGWCTPELLIHKSQILDRHCETIGRDPATIRRSVQALLYLSDDRQWIAARRAERSDRPRLVGNVNEIADQVSAYVEAGADELIIPDWTLGDPIRRAETLDRFLTEVADQLR